MSNALLSDVDARAERRRTRTAEQAWQEDAQDAWTRATGAATPADRHLWLGRAHRLAPQDATVGAALAASLLALGHVAEAAELFERLAAGHDLAEAWAGLATCAHLLGQPDRARHALSARLRLRRPDRATIALADAIAPGTWCGLDPDGTFHAPPGTTIRLDGRPAPLLWTGRTARLPPGWRAAETLDTTPALLGSPLPLRRFAGAEGFVEARDGGVAGWAWLPADPAQDPTVLARGPRGERRLCLSEPQPDARALARPRRLALDAAAVSGLGAPLALLGPDGRHLLGSPLDPGLEQAGPPAFTPVWADVRGAPPAPGPAPRTGPAVVVPVFRGLQQTVDCLRSVLATVPRGTEVIVVDDASPDAGLVAALRRLAARRRITLIRQPENRGFPAAANAGLRAASGRDAVLLNSDTIVPPGWLQRLRAAAWSAPDVGTVTPLTNDGTVNSYPDPHGPNPVPDEAGTIRLDALAQRANPGGTAEIPVGVGFCLYIRHDCLQRIGPLREDLFAQGYGEENDLCLRARHAGWRNLAALDTFVAHHAGTSFGTARAHLLRRNAAILARLHPGYDELVAAHLRADPLLPARRRMDALRWAAARARRPSATILVTHAGGGGVDEVIRTRAAAIRAAGGRPIVLRPWRSAAGIGLRVEEPGGPPVPNLLFALPAELPDLLRLLRADRPAGLELHHVLGHEASVAGLARRLRVPLTSVVHDYARFCPRIALVSTERRYCGEPDVRTCQDCVDDLGSRLEDDPPVATLIERSARELAAAARIVVPSRDAAARIRRHFPGTAPQVEPWEDDAALPPPDPAPDPAPGSSPRHVVVVGAVGVEKGYDVLLACVRDAGRRALALRFTVVGFTMDDARLMAAGPVHVTGPYAEAEAVALIRQQRAHLALIPSVWPETWCFALSRAWQAGLPAAVFDLGAQAERVRNTGRGWLLPLGLPPARVNDLLLRLAPSRPTGHSPATSYSV